jgi:hypothetical protein
MKRSKFIILMGNRAPEIRLSGSQSLPEDTPLFENVGILSVRNGSGVYTFTITSDPDSKFDDANQPIISTAGTFDYETATSHNFTVQADNGVDPVLTRTFTITITDVAEGGGTAGEPIGLLLSLTKAA